MRAAVKNRLSRLLYERGWPDRVLAAHTGIERARINRLKNRRALPSVREALLISSVLSIPIDAIFWLATDDRA
jgi:DNA-binding XRE family transcriptional regulator